MRERKVDAVLTLQDIANSVGGELVGRGDVLIRALCPLDEPRRDALSFCKSSKSSKLLESISNSECAAFLVSKNISDLSLFKGINLVLVDNPFESLLELVPVFFPKKIQSPTVSPFADVHPTARLGQGVAIGAFCSIGPNVVIGDGVVIHPQTTVYEGALIGARSIIHSGAVIRESCELGEDCVVQNGAIIGADGFSYLPDPVCGLRAVPQMGIAKISDGVDVGANTCIDRATLGTTVVGRGSKLDNLVQIGHNTKIGSFSVFCGQSGVAGSCAIGNKVSVGGATAISDHVRIVDGCRIGGKSGIMGNLDEPGEYVGFPHSAGKDWKRQQAAIRQLPRLRKELNTLKAELRVLKSGSDSSQGIDSCTAQINGYSAANGHSTPSDSASSQECGLMAEQEPRNGK